MTKARRHDQQSKDQEGWRYLPGQSLDPATFHIQIVLTTTTLDRVHIFNPQLRGGGMGNGPKGALIR